MIYNGVEIEKPTLEQVRSYIKSQHCIFSAEDFYNYWEKREWKHNNKNNSNVKNLRIAVNIFNDSILRHINIQRKKAKKKGEEKLTKDNASIIHMAHILAEQEINKSYQTKKKETAKVEKPIKEKKTPSEAYRELLEDPKWKAFRQFIFAVRGNKCEVCGENKYLQVHHPKYISGRKPWEYTCKDVIVVCGSCHKKIHGIKE